MQLDSRKYLDGTVPSSKKKLDGNGPSSRKLMDVLLKKVARGQK
jgi:hypothetical protein